MKYNPDNFFQTIFQFPKNLWKHQMSFFVIQTHDKYMYKCIDEYIHTMILEENFVSVVHFKLNIFQKKFKKCLALEIT